MVLATVLFALMGVCVKLASVHFSTPLIVFVRGLVGVVVVGVLAWTQAAQLRTRVPMLHLRRGLAGTTALALWFYTMAHLPLATAVTLNYMSSVWMAVFLVGAALLWGQGRVDRRLVLAVLVGFAGVALVLQPTLQREQWAAGLVGLISGMLSAVAYLQVRELGRAGEPEVRVVFYFSLVGALAGLLACWVFGAARADRPYADLPTSAWAELLGVGVFATVAQLAMTRAYALGRALVNANLQYLGIVHAFLFGVLLFDEPVSLLALVGVALIVAAGVASTRLQQPSGELG